MNPAPGKLAGDGGEAVLSIRTAALPLFIKRSVTLQWADLIVWTIAGAPHKDLVEKFARLAETYPEGVLTMLYGRMLYDYAWQQFGQADKGEASLVAWLRDAQAMADLAIKRPMIVPLRTWALDDLIEVEGALGSPKRAKPDLEMRERARLHVKERLALQPPVRSRRYLWLFYRIALTAGDRELARSILTEWERQYPKDQEALKERAILEFGDGAYGRAILAARRALESKKDDIDLKKMLPSAAKKLQEEAREYGDLLRMPP